jgi:hypothetical protein
MLADTTDLGRSYEYALSFPAFLSNLSSELNTWERGLDFIFYED